MIMGRKRKFERQERKFLKKAGFGREHKDMGALACALEDVKNAPYVPGYSTAPYLRWGRLLRKRVRRERWNRQVRVMRRFSQLGVIYLGCLAAVLLLVAGVYELVRRFLM